MRLAAMLGVMQTLGHIIILQIYNLEWKVLSPQRRRIRPFMLFYIVLLFARFAKAGQIGLESDRRWAIREKNS